MEPSGQDLFTRMEQETCDSLSLCSDDAFACGRNERTDRRRPARIGDETWSPSYRPTFGHAQITGAFDHVGVALLGDGRSELDALLAAAGVSRRIALMTPHFMAALATVAATKRKTRKEAAFT